MKRKRDGVDRGLKSSLHRAYSDFRTFGARWGSVCMRGWGGRNVVEGRELD